MHQSGRKNFFTANAPSTASNSDIRTSANSPKTDAQERYRMTTAEYELNNSGAKYSSGGHHDRLSKGNSECKKHYNEFRASLAKSY